ncbi:trehalose-phosphatase [candidate division WOR-1 bacterium RIFOXYB2_FULL_48_7]|uniref:Trehalose 6-phosphate phosphatase n=1 Tax=candidate division WOR-1 bacterium RIFOXYB2_FULL_48_7 TaxID=1802583 RepID=A0A1F4TTN4_UNCSA|nr:MAG: trehalose-phosphatase [candidate division WOR-1 bacterium RIFOXYB2_FULL_48_7]
MKPLLWLFLDFDGTLVAIRKRPQWVYLSIDHRQLLRQLAKLASVKLVFISGRAIEDLKKQIRVQPAVYVGNHGYEIEADGRRQSIPHVKGYVPMLKQIKKEITEKLRIKGVWLEDKGVTLTLHYREMNRKHLPEVESNINALRKRWAKRLRFAKGKEVWEISPGLNWHKGAAVERLLKPVKASHAFPIYIGDDRTDENAFRSLGGQGLAVAVGQRLRFADCSLVSIREVYWLLKTLYEHFWEIK